MAEGLTMRINRREFDATLRKYVGISKREIPDIINTKAFFIGRRAVVETIKADAKDIRDFIRRDSGAIIGMLVNKRRGDRGEPGLYGKLMAEAVAVILAARLKSRAFFKSGWLPGIKTLEAHVDYKYRRGAARKDRNAAVVGQAKGRAVPARSGWRVQALIENSASSDHDKKEALIKYGEPALQRAFDFETRSMLDYIARRLNDAAQRSGVRTR